MRCKKTQRLLNMYIDNELATEVHSAVQGHIGVCQKCSTTLNELNKLKELVGTTTPYPVNPFLWTRIAAALKEEIPIPIGVLVPKFLKIWVPVAAALILFCGFLLYKTERPVYTKKSLIQTAVLDIPITQENMEKITLNLLVYTNGGMTYAKF